MEEEEGEEEEEEQVGGWGRSLYLEETGAVAGRTEGEQTGLGFIRTFLLEEFFLVGGGVALDEVLELGEFHLG